MFYTSKKKLRTTERWSQTHDIYAWQIWFKFCFHSFFVAVCSFRFFPWSYYIHWLFRLLYNPSFMALLIADRPIFCFVGVRHSTWMLWFFSFFFIQLPLFFHAAEMIFYFLDIFRYNNKTCWQRFWCANWIRKEKKLTWLKALVTLFNQIVVFINEKFYGIFFLVLLYVVNKLSGN